LYKLEQHHTTRKFQPSAIRQNVMKIIAIIATFLSMVSAQPPPAIISELMVNPTVGKDKGTWFEFYNPGNQPFIMSNRYLRIAKYNASREDLGLRGLDQTVIKIPVGLAIPPKQYFVFGNNDDRASNGNVPVDYKYSPHVEMNESFGYFTMTEANDVTADAVAVAWGYFGLAAAPFQAGASLSFRNVTNLPSKIALPLNATYYCVSVTSYSGAPAGAKGTPNATNSCVLPPTTPTPPTKSPTRSPTKAPVKAAKAPTRSPVVSVDSPTSSPNVRPTAAPTKAPVKAGTMVVSKMPTKSPVKTAPVVVSKMPSKSPVKAATGAPIAKKTKQCGLLGLRILCPFTKCGIVGRSLGWCKN
jgi:hypothetical protein